MIDEFNEPGLPDSRIVRELRRLGMPEPAIEQALMAALQLSPEDLAGALQLSDVDSE